MITYQSVLDRMFMSR